MTNPCVSRETNEWTPFGWQSLVLEPKGEMDWVDGWMVGGGWREEGRGRSTSFFCFSAPAMTTPAVCDASPKHAARCFLPATTKGRASKQASAAWPSLRFLVDAMETLQSTALVLQLYK